MVPSQRAPPRFVLRGVSLGEQDGRCWRNSSTATVKQLSVKAGRGSKGNLLIQDDSSGSRRRSMTESNLKLGAQNTAKMHELIAGMCVVTFKEEGDRRGMIEHIESLMGSGVSGLYPPS